MAEEFLSWMQGRQLRSDVVPWSRGEMAWFLKYNPTKKLFFLILPVGWAAEFLGGRQWEVMKEESLGAQTGFLMLFGLDGWGQVGYFLLDAFIHLSPLIAMEVRSCVQTHKFCLPCFWCVFWHHGEERTLVVSKQNGGVPSQVGSMDPSKIQF